MAGTARRQLRPVAAEAPASGEPVPPARRLDRVWGLVPLLFAIPVLAGIAVSTLRLLGTSQPEADFLWTVNDDAEALFLGAPLYRDPDEGFTGMIYTPLLPAVVSLLLRVSTWTGWPLVLSLAASVALIGLVAWLAHRRRSSSGGDRALAVVEAVGIGALGFALVSCVQINGIYSGRIDQPAWALALFGLALVPHAVRGSSGATTALLGAVLLLSAAFWTRQNTVVAPLAAVAWAALAARGGAAAPRRAGALALGLVALNALVFAVLQQLTGGWAAVFHFSIPATHSLGDLGGPSPANPVRYLGEVAGVTALAVLLLAALTLVVRRERVRRLAAGAGEDLRAAAPRRRAALALLALAVAGSALIAVPYLLTVAAGRPLEAGLAVVVAGCALLSASVLGWFGMLGGMPSESLRLPSARGALAGGFGLMVGAFAFLKLSALPFPPSSLGWLGLRAGAGAGLAVLGALALDRAWGRAGSAPAALRGVSRELTAGSTRRRVVGVLAVFLVLDLLATLYMRQKLGGDDHYYVGMAWALALLVAAAWRRARAGGGGLPAAACLAAVFALLLIGSPSPGPPNAVSLPSFAPVADEDDLDRAGFAVYLSSLGLFPVTEWDETSSELRALAARQTVYDPRSGDPVLGTRGALYPSFDNWYGMVAAGRRPGYLIEALTQQRFDALMPFDEGKWSEEFASGRGRFEANFVQKLNRVIEAKYAPARGLPEGFLARRPGADPAPWMQECFGPFELAGARFGINRGGGFWCAAPGGSALSLVETRAALSDVRTEDPVTSIGGELGVVGPRRGEAFEVSLEPDGGGGGGGVRLRGERRGERLVIATSTGERLTAPSGQRLRLAFGGPLGEAPLELFAGGRRLARLSTEGLDRGAVLRLAGSRRSRVRFELGGLRLG